MTTTIRHPAHYHVTVRRVGRTVTVEAPNAGMLVSAKCESTEAAKICERNTIRSWRAAAGSL